MRLSRFQGFGERRSAAKLDDAGARVVATSDVTGAAYDPDGLDVATLAAHADAGGLIDEYVGGEIRATPDERRVDDGSRWDDPDAISNAELLTPRRRRADPRRRRGADHRGQRQRPASLRDRRGGQRADDGRRRRGAHGSGTSRSSPISPRTPAGHRLVPRWVQNAQEFSWPLETVNAELERRIGTAFDQTIDQYDQKDLPDLRTAAYTLALERTASAHEYRGLFP